MSSLPPYPVLCHAPGCSRLAAFKIGAAWSDGTTRELKTYSLCCATCLPSELTSARARREQCRQAPGETLGPACVFELRPSARDRDLVRLEYLE